MVWKALLVAAASYLLGSIPFGYLLYRLRRGEDIREVGSGNIGATNVLRAGGVAAGVTTLFLDAVKGYLAVVLAARIAGASPEWSSLAAVVAVGGHIFSAFLKFRGGKGVATALGAFLGIAPVPVLVAAGIFVMAAAVWRYVSLASIVAVGSFPVVLLALGGYPGALVASAFATSAMIVFRHSSNMRRLWSGTEARILRKQRTSAP
jgi:glycerol-3-phosphate acyltransferase PlsY